VRFLGIDPGLRVTGYGCVEGSGLRNGAKLVEAGAIRLVRASKAGAGAEEEAGEVADAASVSSRLVELEGDVIGILDRLRPDVCAVEALFSHYKHPATAIVMGHARGVILLCLRRAGVKLVELRPAEVKKSMCGNGQAKKAQVQLAVQARFGLAEVPKPPDVADAIAIALCASERAERGESAFGIRQ
jgi:crossover junction endodeoxyribonuclease RuvC